MGKFSFRLPPFAPDYSGVCAALFSLGGLVVIHDAAGCTGNYVGFDEPRWYGSKTMLYCSGLRELDAVLGNDDKLIQNVAEAARKLRPAFLALVGSPVPALIGTDLPGIAAQLEAETGLPAFGFSTTGMELYVSGAYECGRALIERFGGFEEEREKGERRPAETLEQGSVNILGDTPLDFGMGKTMEELKAYLKEEEIGVNASLWDGADLECLSRLDRARLNVAVSLNGHLLAGYLEKKTKVPSLSGFPLDENARAPWRRLAEEAVRCQKSLVWGNESAMCGREGRLLILGDQIMANSLRASLWLKTGRTACVGLPLGGCQEAMGRGDLLLKDEAQIEKALNDPSFDTIIADPLFAPLIEKREEKRFLSLPHYAVSSKVGKTFGRGLEAFSLDKL